MKFQPELIGLVLISSGFFIMNFTQSKYSIFTKSPKSIPLKYYSKT